MTDADTPALDAEPTPTPAAPQPQATAIDPVSAYQNEVAAIASAPVPAGYVDPHFEDRSPDQDEFRAIDTDPDAGGLGDDTPANEGTEQEQPTAQAEAAHEEAQDPVLEQAEPANDNDNDSDTDTPPADDPSSLTPTADGNKPPQFRLRPKDGDKVGEATLRLMRRNPDMNLEDAVAAARKNLGTSTEAEEAPQGEASLESAQEQPATLNLEQLEAERADLKKQKREARAEMDFDKLNQVEARLDEIEDDLIPQARETEARRAADSNGAFEAAVEQALDLYPDVGSPESELHKRMVEIEQDLQAASDPLLRDPQSPLRIAQMAAKELSIAPKRKGQAQPPAAAAPPQKPDPRPPQARPALTAPLAAPGARSMTPPVPAYEQQIAAISTEEDYLAAKQALFGTRH